MLENFIKNNILILFVSFFIFLFTTEGSAQYGNPYTSRNRTSDNDLITHYSMSEAGGKIDQILERKRQQAYDSYVKPIEKQIREKNKQITALNKLVRHIKDLEDHAKRFYSIDNSPFRNLQAISSDPESFTGSTQRYAMPGEYEVEVIQTASEDAMNSDKIDIDEVLPAGTFQIRSGEDVITVNFEGGTLNDLSLAINKAAQGKVVSAFAARVDERNYVMGLTGQKQGEKNRLRFSGDLRALEAAGLIGEATEVISQKITEQPLITSEELTPIRPVGESQYSLTDENNVILPFGSAIDILLIFSQPFSTKTRVQLEGRFDNAEDLLSKLGRTDFGVGHVDMLEVGEFKIYDESLIPTLGIGLSRGIDALYYAGAMTGKDGILSEYKMDEPEAQWKTYTLEIGFDTNASEELTKLRLQNSYDGKVFSFRNLKIIFEKDEKQLAEEQELNEDLRDSRPGSNFRSRGQNAIVKIAGIEIRRPSNTIEDAIPSVTLYAHQRSEFPGKLTIKQDIDTIIAEIADLIFYYNVVVGNIYNFTLYPVSKTEAQLQHEREMEAYKDDELKQLENMFGVPYTASWPSDNVLFTIRDQLRNVLVQPYETVLGPDLSQIWQLGVEHSQDIPPTRDETASSSRLSEARKTKWLEIPRSERHILVEHLENNFEAVKQLFLQDSDDDMVPDTGIAPTLVHYCQEYYKGKFSTLGSKIAAVDNMLTNQYTGLEKQLVDAQIRVDNEVEELRETLVKMEEQNQRLENFQNRTNNRGGLGQ